MIHIQAVKISADDIKKTIPGYNPEKSDIFHKTSSKLADKVFDSAIQKSEYSRVILMSGGGASGKTEYVDSFLLSESAVIIYDGTLPTIAGFNIKHRKCKKYNKIVEVHAIIPTDLKRAFIAFLNRDRKYPDKHFYLTHSNARRTLLDIATVYPDITIRIIESSYQQNTLLFTELQFDTPTDQLAFLQDIQYTEKEIQQQVV
jgi:hypothetical protein